MSGQFILRNTLKYLLLSEVTPACVCQPGRTKPLSSRCFTTICICLDLSLYNTVCMHLISECLPQCLAKSLITKSLPGDGLYFHKNAKVLKISFVFVFVNACGCICANVGQRATLGIIPLLLSTLFHCLGLSSRKGWLAISYFLDNGIINMGHHILLYHFHFMTEGSHHITSNISFFSNHFLFSFSLFSSVVVFTFVVFPFCSFSVQLLLHSIFTVFVVPFLYLSTFFHYWAFFFFSLVSFTFFASLFPSSFTLPFQYILNLLFVFLNTF